MRRSIVRELIIGFGFLNGLWLAIGVSPEEWIFKFLQPYMTDLPTVLKVIFAVIPTILLLITAYTIWKTYKHGKILGIIAVGLGFIAGAIVFKNWIATIILLAIALILGSISFKGRR